MEALDELQLSAPLLQLISLQTATNQPSQCISRRVLLDLETQIYMFCRPVSVSPFAHLQVPHISGIGDPWHEASKGPLLIGKGPLI